MLLVAHNWFTSTVAMHCPEEVASDPRILCWVMFFPYLGLASLNG